MNDNLAQLHATLLGVIFGTLAVTMVSSLTNLCLDHGVWLACELATRLV